MNSHPITILDYGVGNIAAFQRVYSNLGVEVIVANTAKQIENAKKLILPGVGSFDWAMSKLEKSGLKEPLNHVVSAGTPVLGVCVGMQMMFDYSYEGVKDGFGWIPGHVASIKKVKKSVRIVTPVMGWADVKMCSPSKLFENIAAPRFYFLHSYCVMPVDQFKVTAAVDIGIPIVAAVQDKHIFGTQFHPEKSHSWGVNVLKNFSGIPN